MKTHPIKFLLLPILSGVIAACAQTNPPPVELTFTKDKSLITDSVQFGYLQETNTARSNAWWIYTARPTDASNHLARQEVKLREIRAILSTNEIGPLAFTNTAGQPVQNAYIYRVTFSEAYYHIQNTPGGGRLKLENLSPDLQERLGYDPVAAVAEDFKAYQQKQKIFRTR